VLEYIVLKWGLKVQRFWACSTDRSTCTPAASKTFDKGDNDGTLSHGRSVFEKIPRYLLFDKPAHVIQSWVTWSAIIPYLLVELSRVASGVTNGITDVLGASYVSA
jgi:hypothetical protein